MTTSARAAVRALAASVTFLSVIPIGREVALDGRDVARGTVLFPLAAAALGALAGLIDWQLGRCASPLLAGSVASAAAIALTGALHVDGFADFADSFGGRTPERRLEIMSDSRLGTYGTCAVVVDFAVRAAALSATAGRLDAVAISAAAAALSRTAGPWLAWRLPYARSTRGTGAILAAIGNAPAVAATTLLALAIAVPMVGAATAAAVVATGVSFVLVGRSAVGRIGGITGDVAGAAIELAELSALAVLVCLR